MERQRTPEENEAIVASGFEDKIRRTLGRIPFAQEAVAAWFAARDPATPTRVRVILLAALAYFVMPVDTVPDVIAGLGFTDDAAVLLAAYRAMVGHIKMHHRDQAQRYLED